MAVAIVKNESQSVSIITLTWQQMTAYSCTSVSVHSDYTSQLILRIHMWWWWLSDGWENSQRLHLEDFFLLVLAVVLELTLVTLFCLFVCLFFFFSSKADSTADDASNKLAQVWNTSYNLTIKPQELVKDNVSQWNDKYWSFPWIMRKLFFTCYLNMQILLVEISLMGRRHTKLKRKDKALLWLGRVIYLQRHHNLKWKAMKAPKGG